MGSLENITEFLQIMQLYVICIFIYEWKMNHNLQIWTVLLSHHSVNAKSTILDAIYLLGYAYLFMWMSNRMFTFDVIVLRQVDAALDLSHTQNIGRMIKTHFPHLQVCLLLICGGLLWFSLCFCLFIKIVFLDLEENRLLTC